MEKLQEQTRLQVKKQLQQMGFADAKIDAAIKEAKEITLESVLASLESKSSPNNFNPSRDRDAEVKVLMELGFDQTVAITALESTVGQQFFLFEI
jgi:SOS response regulatory protein OraA/RecX